MPNVVVTVEFGNGYKKDLALPMEVSCRLLAPAIGKALNLEGGNDDTFALIEKDERGDRRLNPNITLADANIVHGRILSLARDMNTNNRMLQHGGAYLLTDMGQQIILNISSISIGRRDPDHNILPDLDLTELDVQNVTSRRHANLEYGPNGYSIIDQGSANGTWVNGRRLPSKIPFGLSEGDEISFGQNGFCVKYHIS